MIQNFIKSTNYKNVFLLCKMFGFFCRAKIYSNINYKNIPIFQEMFVFLKIVQHLNKCIFKKIKLKNILVLTICLKIENKVCIKETHFLKFFCIFKTYSHLKNHNLKNVRIFIRRFMSLRNVCAFQEMFRSNFCSCFVQKCLEFSKEPSIIWKIVQVAKYIR